MSLTMEDCVFSNPELCWKCREERRIGGWIACVPGDHCHHEPREKPKPRCNVCGYGSFRITVDNEYERMGYKVCISIKFCPECGRKL